MKEEEPEENSGTKAYLSLLPPELVLQIMSHLSLGDCYSLSVTARFAQAVFDNELLWKRLCWTHFKIRLDLDHSGRAKDFYRHVLKPYARFIGVWQRDQSVTYFGSLHQMVYCDWALYFLQWFPPRVPDVEQALRKYHMFKIRLDPTLSRAQIEVIDPFYSNGVVGIVPAKPSPTAPSHFQFLIDHLEDFTLEPDLWSENLERFIFLDKGAPYDKRSFVDEMRMVKFMTFCHNRPSHRYNRLQFQSPPQFDVPIKPGLFKGTYGSHGIEMIELKYPSETEYQAVKVTGDPNVPCNEITFKGLLTNTLFLSRAQQETIDHLIDANANSDEVGTQQWTEMPKQCFRIPDNCHGRTDRFPNQCLTRFVSECQVAGHGYLSPEFIGGQFAIFDENLFAVFYLQLMSVSLYHRVQEPLTKRQFEPEVVAESEPPTHLRYGEGV